MNYPIVFNSTQRTFSGFGLAILEKAYNVKIRKVINGEYTLSLTVPGNDEKREFLVEENIIYVDGQAFRIRSLEDFRDSTGKFLLNIKCEHISYDLNDIRHLPKMRDVVNVTPLEVFRDGFYDSDGNFVEGVFNSTDFIIQSDNFGSTDLFLSKTTPRAVLNEFLNDLDCEAEFDNFTIRLVSRIGNANTGLILDTRKNITGIKRTVKSEGLCTRLYPYGKDYLDITSVNDGNAYIDSPLINNYDYIHEDYRDYNDIDDPEELYDKGVAEWSTAERDGIDKPKITYEVDVIELKKIPEFAELQAFNLGDTVRVYDSVMGIDINARITEYEYYPYEAERSSIVLANFKQTLGGMFAQIKKSQNILENMVNKKGEVEDKYIESIRETKAVKFNNSLTKKTVVHDYANMWVDDMDNPTSVIALVDGMFAIANSRAQDGSWNWRTIADGNGLVADSVVSNWVYAGQINASQISSGTINTNLITITSNDGKMSITSNSITMDNGNTSMSITPETGIKYTHKKDNQGRALMTTILDSRGCGKKYDYYDPNFSSFDEHEFREYVDKIFFGKLTGGGENLWHYDLLGPEWRNADPEKLSVIVFPAETLKFSTKEWGREGDVSKYECWFTDAESIRGGIRIYLAVSKTYITRVVNQQPIYATVPLTFNLLVIGR